ncbi:hypothetical protein [Longimicrobium terrae]|uniref:Uncharacterized protein n=1 Tax=Longimicrobium terrae TaxID=1639882 RepID=A0A841H1B9_9BACT|nr:hypothetical protein [Longimicrobium terrae]MBB4637402.1 hypothetical protein [Longimicrobium terrae]MBB6071800.1 hypothetical protein [Longimicrobium terrae]NNC28559.1 hypothetical protein [Longimicrobium terrae]
MRVLRLLLLCAGLVLASGCGGADNLLPPGVKTQSWTALTRSGTGPALVGVDHDLVLARDGDFSWFRTMYGDGVANPGRFMGTTYWHGRFRIRDGFLDLRTDVVGAITNGIRTEHEVQSPQWTGDQYRIAITDSLMTLRYIPLESSSRTEVTIEFVPAPPPF